MRSLVTALALAALLPGALAAQVDPHPGESEELSADEAAALAAADEWLVALDAEDYERSWQQAGEIFRSAVDLASWRDQMAQLHAQLGAVADREFVGVQTTTDPPNSPPGEYIAVVFASVFAHQSDRNEVVVTTRQGGAWHVVGYFVQ